MQSALGMLSILAVGYAQKTNGIEFTALENRVAPMIIKLAETFERSVGSGLSGSGDGGGDNKQAMFKIAKQIKKVREAAAVERKK